MMPRSGLPLRLFLTVVFAAVPATALLLPAGFGFAIAIGAVASGAWEGVLFLIWSLAGFAGTASVWAVLFGSRRAIIFVGLLLGILAVLPISGLYATSLIRDTHAWQHAEPYAFVSLVWAISLPLTAVCWLTRTDWKVPKRLPLDHYRDASASD